MHGSVLESEFFRNSLEPTSIGFNASAIKGIDEYEAGRLFVHDEQGNGIWCDVGCDNDPASGLDDDFWVHDSVVLDSSRAGIRYENSANEALLQNNELHGNGLASSSVRIGPCASWRQPSSGRRYSSSACMTVARPRHDTPGRSCSRRGT
jgi:hypothetical protein